MSGSAPTTLEVRVIPRSRRDEIAGERAGRLLVRTTAPPSDGKANRRVIALVAQHLGVRPGSVEIIAGHRCRDKVLRIGGVHAT